jgi:hypothetical protein
MVHWWNATDRATTETVGEKPVPRPLGLNPHGLSWITNVYFSLICPENVTLLRLSFPGYKICDLVVGYRLPECGVRQPNKIPT